MTTLEAFGDAICRFEGWIAADEHKLGSMSWRHRNPGNLRSAKTAVAHEDGYAVFGSLADGWAALLADIRAKCQGKPFTRTELGPESTIQEFFDIYAPAADRNHPKVYAGFVAQCLTNTTGLKFTVESKLKTIFPG